MYLPLRKALVRRTHPTWRFLHTSPASQMPRALPKHAKKDEDEGLIVKLQDLTDPVDDSDVTSLTHMMLRQQRQVLYYLRLIEHDVPNLVAFRKPFAPPSTSMPLVIRSISYGGEPHPAERKRTLVVPVSRLPLKNDVARTRFKLLAGVRWSPVPPKDAGLNANEHDDMGYFKLSCEQYPRAAMNLKWASDTLSRLVNEANDHSKDTLLDIPYDGRHLEAKLRKAKKGGHAKGRGYTRPTIKDFPQEWLPDLQPMSR